MSTPLSSTSTPTTALSPRLVQRAQTTQVRIVPMDDYQRTDHDVAQRARDAYARVCDGTKLLLAVYARRILRLTRDDFLRNLTETSLVRERNVCTAQLTLPDSRAFTEKELQVLPRGGGGGDQAPRTVWATEVSDFETVLLDVARMHFDDRGVYVIVTGATTSAMDLAGLFGMHVAVTLINKSILATIEIVRQIAIVRNHADPLDPDVEHALKIKETSAGGLLVGGASLRSHPLQPPLPNAAEMGAEDSEQPRPAERETNNPPLQRAKVALPPVGHQTRSEDPAQPGLAERAERAERADEQLNVALPSVDLPPKSEDPAQPGQAERAL